MTASIGGTAARVVEAVDEIADRIADVAQKIHARPELGYEERYAANLLATELEAEGIAVERGAFGVGTALKATLGRPGGARVAICAEYDALPEIGHACGHNLIAAGALGAALGLRLVENELPGEVVFLGTPAEEGGGGKIRLLEAGAFAGLDAAMMFHPFDRTVLWNPALAMTRMEFVFRGRASHAAAAPWDGASALRRYWWTIPVGGVALAGTAVGIWYAATWPPCDQGSAGCIDLRR